MTRKMNVRLGNPVVMSFWSFAMLLLRIVISVYWHPSPKRAVTLAIAGVFTTVHELVCSLVLFVGVVERPAHGGTQGRTLTIPPRLGRQRRFCGRCRCCPIGVKMLKIDNAKLLYRR